VLVDEDATAFGPASARSFGPRVEAGQVAHDKAGRRLPDYLSTTTAHSVAKQCGASERSALQ